LINYGIQGRPGRTISVPGAGRNLARRIRKKMAQGYQIGLETESQSEETPRRWNPFSVDSVVRVPSGSAVTYTNANDANVWGMVTTNTASASSE
jgi:hypothetical protein